MEIAELVERLEGQGVTLTVAGDRVRLRTPADQAPSPEVLECLRKEKQALIVYLRARTASNSGNHASGVERMATCRSPHCAGCYDVGDERKIHPPKCGENYRKWLKRWKPMGTVQ